MKLYHSVLFCSLLFSPLAFTQTPTKEQCTSSVRARTFRLEPAQIEQLCAANHPFSVINCAVTKVQGSGSAKDLDGFVKSCTLENVPRRYRKKVEPTPAVSPVPTVTVPVEELTKPLNDEDTAAE
ncbi:hypothetical protein D3C87_145790 [compost metagenome]